MSPVYHRDEQEQQRVDQELLPQQLPQGGPPSVILASVKISSTRPNNTLTSAKHDIWAQLYCWQELQVKFSETFEKNVGSFKKCALQQVCRYFVVDHSLGRLFKCKTIFLLVTCQAARTILVILPILKSSSAPSLRQNTQTLQLLKYFGLLARFVNLSFLSDFSPPSC